MNLELNLSPDNHRQLSPKKTSQIAAVDGSGPKKVNLQKNLSNVNFLNKERSKKVTFKKGTQSMAMLQEALKTKNQSTASLDGTKLPPGDQAAAADPMMHIQQIVKKNRYGLPGDAEVEENKDLKDLDIEVTRE